MSLGSHELFTVSVFVIVLLPGLISPIIGETEIIVLTVSPGVSQPEAVGLSIQTVINWLAPAERALRFQVSVLPETDVGKGLVR